MKRLSLIAPFLVLLAAVACCACSGRAAEGPKPNAAVSPQGAPAASAFEAATSPVALPAGDTEGPVPLNPEDARWGSDAAPVTLIMSTDLQCPFCARADATVHALMNRYGPARLRVVFKHLPLEFHPLARPAALAAMRVQREKGDGAFFDYVSVVLTRQRELTEESLWTWAGAMGPSGPKRTFTSSPDDQLARDVEFSASHGIRGTPNFLVNGRAIMGAQPLDVFVAAIDGELAAIDAARAQGQPVTYAARTAVNYVKPEAEVAAEDPDADRVYNVPVGKSPVLGSPDALVTIVEFADYQCPFCQRAHRTMEQVMDRYGADVRLVFKHRPLPFHDRAGPSAALALEAYRERGHEVFWRVTRSLFEAPKEALSDASLVNLGKALQLKPDKVKAALAKGDREPEIQADVALADSLQANGTPCFFINGQRVPGAQPLEVFTSVIDEQLQAARAMVAAGAARRDVYDRIMSLAN